MDLLDPTDYYTTTPSRRVRRQRINDNLLGDSRHCPTVRRTEELRAHEAADLPRRCREVASGYPRRLLSRALGYLYEKETKSSFEIENVELDSSRTGRFIALQDAEQQDHCQRMETGNVHPVVHAAAIAYAFVFLHPFEDGNGRIHRFLIHNILARRGFTPAGMIVPVSAAMLHRPNDYDASLEAFSHQLMPLVNYVLDDDGRLTVRNETTSWYRFIDLTAEVEALFRFLKIAIEDAWQDAPWPSPLLYGSR